MPANGQGWPVISFLAIRMIKNLDDLISCWFQRQRLAGAHAVPEKLLNRR
jgi:hypothetical protein